MTAGAVAVVVNGRERAIPSAGGASTTLRDVLLAEGVDPARRGVAVALNDAVVPRARWDRTEVASGDRVEIVEAAQGG